jgi:pimeloyl-ACP methyl ester carboxylesterase
VRLAAVPVLPREVKAEVGWVYQPGQYDAISAPTLVLAGGDSPDAQQDATQRATNAIPHAEIHRLDGHTHIAHRTDPALVAALVVEFNASVHHATDQSLNE